MGHTNNERGEIGQQTGVKVKACPRSQKSMKEAVALRAWLELLSSFSGVPGSNGKTSL